MPIADQVEYLRGLRQLEGLARTETTPAGVGTSPFATGLYRER